MPKFEAPIHNQDVADCIKRGERHKDYRDDWAEVHYIEFEAENIHDARTKAERKYPRDRGFVIGRLQLIQD